MPQAFRIVTPAIGNDFVAMIKDSSLASVVGVQEILWRAQAAGRPTFQSHADAARRGVRLLGADDHLLAVPGPPRAAHGDRRPRPERATMTTAVDPRPSTRCRSTGRSTSWPHPAEMPGKLVKPGADADPPRDRHREALRRPPRAQGLLDDGLPGRDRHDPGPFGSGKSTFLRCLNFLEEPTAGVVDINNIVVAAQPLKRRDRAGREQIRQLRLHAGMVFQEFNLFPHLSVIGNLVEAPDPRQEDGPAGGDRTRRGEPREGRPQREARRVPVTAVRRPAPARRDRPGADDGAGRAAVRRAHERARPVARRRGAQGHGEPRPRGPDDDRGHPRDGVRARGGRPRLLHGRGPVRRDRAARAGALEPDGRADADLPEALPAPVDAGHSSVDR